MRADAYQKCQNEEPLCAQVINDSKSAMANSLVNYYYNWEPYSNTKIDINRISKQKKKQIDALISKMMDTITKYDSSSDKKGRMKGRKKGRKLSEVSNEDEDLDKRQHGLYEYVELYYTQALVKELEALLEDEASTYV